MTKDYEEKFQAGLKYQDFVKHELYKIGIPIVFNDSKHYQYTEGENILGIEIKHDRRFTDTGNLYIETAEKTDPEHPFFTTSGAFREDNSWLYLIGDYKCIYIFDIKMLKRISGWPKTQRKETPTSQGFLIPRAWADEYCIRHIKVKENP